MASEARSADPSYLSYLSYQRGAPPPPSPVGVVYNTAMARPDAALALAALYVFESKRQARVGAVCVAGAGLNTAIYCDIVARFYSGPARNGNSALAVGLPDVTPLPADPPMVMPAIARKKPDGEPQYLRSIRQFSDTSQAEAVLRNGIVFNAETVVVLSAPAAPIARSLDLAGAKDQYKQRVRRVVIVEGDGPQRDPVALRKFIADCPAPMFLCGKDVGEALLFPGAHLETMFTAPAGHPIVDAYRAFKTMPYDAPLHDLAALHFAVHPDSGFFTPSGPGTLSVSDQGAVTFAEGGGSVRRLTVDPAKKAEALAALLAIATAVPAAPAGRGRGGA
jgi:hypothetical protein